MAAYHFIRQSAFLQYLDCSVAWQLDILNSGQSCFWTGRLRREIVSAIRLDWLYSFLGTEIVSFLIVVIVFGLIIWFITKEPGGKKFTNFISDTLKGIGLK